MSPEKRTTGSEKIPNGKNPEKRAPEKSPTEISPKISHRKKRPRKKARINDPGKNIPKGFFVDF